MPARSCACGQGRHAALDHVREARRIPLQSFYASASTDGRRPTARSGARARSSHSTRNGHVEWKHHLSSWGYSTPAVGDDRVFIGGFDGALHAYRKTDGKELWRAHVGGRILGGPLIVGNLVFFSTLEQKTYAARVDTGQIVWRYPIGKYSPGIATERAYYFTLNGILVALRGHGTRRAEPRRRVTADAGGARRRAASY
jgi:outer membrane protein assembly factor BamB